MSSSSMTSSHPLKGVEVLAFDVFGTVVDWQNTGVRVLKEKARLKRNDAINLEGITETDWTDFIKEWRNGYRQRTYVFLSPSSSCFHDPTLTITSGFSSRLPVKSISAGLHGLGGRTLSVDVMHREILDEMLSSDRWSVLAEAWGEEDRQELVMLWHKLDGWPDSSSGLKSLKETVHIVTLSNGNVRLLADMAKHADLPWDVILSAELLGSFKPDPKVYLGALHHLSVRPERCAMVAAHIFDLRAAASQAGMRTVYVRRPTEDIDVCETVKAKSEGGEVDVVVDGLQELAVVLKEANKEQEN